MSLPVPYVSQTPNITPAQRRLVQHLVLESLSDNTKKSYATAWRNFCSWCDRHGFLPLPAPPEAVAIWLSDLAAQENKAVATIRLYRTAVATIHRMAHYPDPTDNQVVRRMLQGIAREHGRPQKQAQGLTSEKMAVIRNRNPLRRRHGRWQESEATAARRHALDLALLSVLRYGLLRISEAAALTWGDLALDDDGTGILTVQRSKTDQEGQGAQLFVGHTAVQALLAIRPEGEVDPNMPIFGLSARQLDRRIKAAAQAAELGEGYSGHSGRVGMAQDLVRNRVQLPGLMVAGRWQSASMPARYTARQSIRHGAVAQYCEARGE